MKNFRELIVWKKAHEWVIAIYRVTEKFPPDERFGIVSQLRRSAASITANIAEGCGREGDRELSRFMSIAAGSASESEYHLLLAYDLGFIDKENYEILDYEINEIKKMLNSFIKQLRANSQ